MRVHAVPLLKDIYSHYDLVAARTEAQITSICDLLLTNKRASYLEVLQCMCISQGRAIKAHQIQVLRYFESHESLLSLCNTESEQSRRLVDARDGDYINDDSFLKYHLCCIDLLTSTAARRNDICQHICRRLLPLGNVLVILNNDAVPNGKNYNI